MFLVNSMKIKETPSVYDKENILSRMDGLDSKSQAKKYACKHAC